MPIISSYTISALQEDGRAYIKEQHRLDTGEVYEYEWLGDPVLAQQVLNQRQEYLEAQLVAKNAVDAIVAGTALPLSLLDFMHRFTLQEEAAIRVAAKTDPIIEVLLSRLAAATTVRVSHPDIQSGIGYLVQKGLLSQERASTILAS